jgi:hypothetical protein
MLAQVINRGNSIVYILLSYISFFIQDEALTEKQESIYCVCVCVCVCVCTGLSLRFADWYSDHCRDIGTLSNGTA